MWFIYAIATFILWGLADLFYKKGNNNDVNNSHYKTGMMVGLVMGIHATLYLIIKRPSIEILDVIKYLPVSLCYIISMIIGYKGLKYIELSISSPIQNSSGIITSLLLVTIYHITLKELEWFGIILITGGVLCLSLLEKTPISKKKRNIVYILFPIVYALIDGAGTFLDGIYLDQRGIVSEDTALIGYEYTFFIYAIILFLIFKFKRKEKISFHKEKDKIIAALFETGGQFFYVFAMAGHSALAAPIVATYSILSVILSRLFLKEELNRYQYVSIAIIMLGIFVIGLAEGIA